MPCDALTQPYNGFHLPSSLQLNSCLFSKTDSYFPLSVKLSQGQYCFLSTKYMPLTKTIIMLNFIVSWSVHVCTHACSHTLSHTHVHILSFSLSHTHTATKIKGHQGRDLTWSCPYTWGDLWMCPYLCPWGKLWVLPHVSLENTVATAMGFQGGTDPACQCKSCRRSRFHPRKIPWRRKWQPTPVFLVWRIPWTEEPGGLQSIGSQRVRCGHCYICALGVQHSHNFSWDILVDMLYSMNEAK